MSKQHSGVVRKLNESVGFGYVDDRVENRRYIFNFEAVPARLGQRPVEIGLKVGAEVKFSTDDDGRVIALTTVAG